MVSNSLTVKYDKRFHATGWYRRCVQAESDERDLLASNTSNALRGAVRTLECQ